MLAPLAAVVGALLGLAAHDLAAQALADLPFRPFAGTCHRCGRRRGWLMWACPECGERPTRAIGVVVISAAAASLFALAVGPGWLLAPYAVFLTLTAALCLTDIDSMRIVDRLNLRGSALAIAALGLAALAEGRADDLWRALLGALAYFAGAFLLFVIARGNGFGAGDVKLAPVLGAFTSFLGWVTLGRAVLGMAFIGGILAVGALVFSEAKRDTELPYGPAMILGAWVAIAIVGISAI